MAIRVAETSTVTKRAYPSVCRNRKYPDLLVLFTSEREGICLAPKDHPYYGRHFNDWDAENHWIPTCVTIDSTGEV
jgi:hypothetical protein